MRKSNNQNYDLKNNIGMRFIGTIQNDFTLRSIGLWFLKNRDNQQRKKKNKQTKTKQKTGENSKFQKWKSMLTS